MEQEKDNAKEQPTAEDPGEGDKPATTPLIDQANEAAKRLEEANARQEELLARQEEIYAKQRLGGQSDAGQPTEKKEETPAEYVKKVLSGEV